MPTIDVQVLEGVFDEEDKANLISALTKAFGEVAGQTLRDNLSIRIHEVQSGSWGYAGNVLTTDIGRSMRARG